MKYSCKGFKNPFSCFRFKVVFISLINLALHRRSLLKFSGYLSCFPYFTSGCFILNPLNCSPHLWDSGFRQLTSILGPHPSVVKPFALSFCWKLIPVYVHSGSYWYFLFRWLQISFGTRICTSTRDRNPPHPLAQINPTILIRASFGWNVTRQ